MCAEESVVALLVVATLASTQNSTQIIVEHVETNAQQAKAAQMEPANSINSSLTSFPKQKQSISKLLFSSKLQIS